MVEFTKINISGNYIYAHAKDYDFNYEADIKFSLDEPDTDFYPKNATPSLKSAVVNLILDYKDGKKLRERMTVSWG